MSTQTPPVTRLDYCQYLLRSPINYTWTNFADHRAQLSHDAVHRSLAGDRIPPRLVWENVPPHVVQTDDGSLVFDDTVVDKHFSRRIALVRRQYSGNAHGIITGIGVVPCVDVNPTTGQFWIIDYRIEDPEGDGKSKLDHVQERCTNAVYHKSLHLRGVLRDTWYATTDLRRCIDRLGKVYDCPLKANRHVDDSGGTRPSQRVHSLEGTADALAHGKTIKIKDFPKASTMKLFRVVLSTQRTDSVVTNDGAPDDTSATRQVCGWRWKMEQFHRETKQLTGLEGCQCRKARIVRHPIGCASLVWVRLTQVAHETRRTMYQVKHDLLSDYLRQQLRSPTVNMVLA
jgi:hypothetical protein